MCKSEYIKRVIKWILICAILILVFVQIAALIKCEILTKKYYSDFEYAYSSNGMLEDIEYFKVLECDGKKAKVYYVSEGNTIANILSFQMIESSWEETEWETIWSASGSASKVVWPYWWHFIYSGL